MTLKFDGLPEDQALDIILRALPGYLAARRAVPMADASMYDRIAADDHHHAGGRRAGRRRGHRR